MIYNSKSLGGILIRFSWMIIIIRWKQNKKLKKKRNKKKTTKTRQKSVFIKHKNQIVFRSKLMN